jgi:hypothetical protein
VLWRLDRIGRQIEAVSPDIRVEVAELLGNEDRANETLREWKENREQAAKETRPDFLGRRNCAVRRLAGHQKPIVYPAGW